MNKSDRDQSRTSKVLKNSLVSIIAQIQMLLLSFINRKVFVIFMDVQLLGYDNLFANIFNLLNVTELGFGTIITFHLYRELANNKKSEITKLMNLYKTLYRIVACVVAFLGLIIYFILPYIISDQELDWSFVHIIYWINLVGTVLGYFLSYKRTLYIADQREYITIEADLISKFITQVFQIVAIAVFKDFILYTVIRIGSTLLANLIISIKANRNYSYINNYREKASREEITKWNIVSDAKNGIVHRIAYAIYNGVDNIVISAICGLTNVALYSNYFLIQSNVNGIIILRILNPIQASIGNYVYSKEDKKAQLDIFYTLDIACVWLASFAMAGYILFFQPFITWWLGEKYLLSFSFVFAFSITSYLTISFAMLHKYRSTFGDYKKDKSYMIASAIINIIASVVLAKWIGMLGVQIGTILGLIPIIYGRLHMVFDEMFAVSKKQYLIDHVKYFVLEIAQCIFMLLIVQWINTGIISIIIRIILLIFTPTVFNYLFFRKNEDFIRIKPYILHVSNLIKRKLCGNNNSTQ